MKKAKNTLIVTLVALAMVFTTACGGSSFDASGYITSFMDALTKGEVTEYATITGQTEEEAGQEYQSFLDSMREAFAEEGVTDETLDKIVDVYVQVLKQAKYTVHEAEKTEEGYDVTVDIEPITGLYDGLVDEVTENMDAAVESGELTSDNLYDWIYSNMADKMVTRLESLGYGEAQSITFHLVKQDKDYEIKDQDSVSQQLGEMLVDQSGISQE
jgi:predicted ATP-grasp superfamily ATP-dependent carboligase